MMSFARSSVSQRARDQASPDTATVVSSSDQGAAARLPGPSAAARLPDPSAAARLPGPSTAATLPGPGVAARLQLVTPRAGCGVCELCFNLIGPKCRRCRACAQNRDHLERLLPISYVLSGSPLHRTLAGYKRDADPSVPHAVADLATILERFLACHELCLGDGQRFELVTTVPSGDRRRDELHPLRRIVSEMIPSVAGRHRRLLRPSARQLPPHTFDSHRFEALQQLHGERVLLIDDTWATGASVQSAAAALRAAGTGAVAAVVIGRYLNRGWPHNVERLQRLGGAFDWNRCVRCAKRHIDADAA